MAAAAETNELPPTVAECEGLLALMSDAGFTAEGPAERFLPMVSRDDIPLSSLEVIMLLIKHMENLALDTGEFSPDWVELLNTVPGVIQVMNLIEERAAHG